MSKSKNARKQRDRAVANLDRALVNLDKAANYLDEVGLTPQTESLDGAADRIEELREVLAEL